MALYIFVHCGLLITLVIRALIRL